MGVVRGRGSNLCAATKKPAPLRPVRSQFAQVQPGGNDLPKGSVALCELWASRASLAAVWQPRRERIARQAPAPESCHRAMHQWPSDTMLRGPAAAEEPRTAGLPICQAGGSPGYSGGVPQGDLRQVSHLRNNGSAVSRHDGLATDTSCSERQGVLSRIGKAIRKIAPHPSLLYPIVIKTFHGEPLEK